MLKKPNPHNPHPVAETEVPRSLGVMMVLIKEERTMWGVCATPGWSHMTVLVPLADQGFLESSPGVETGDS